MPLYLGTESAGTDQFTLQDFEPSFKDKLDASIKESWMESYGPVAVDWMKSKGASDEGPKLTPEETAAVIKESGTKLHGAAASGQYTRSQLDLLLSRQRELTAVKDVRERTPWDMGSVIRGGAMFGAGIVDPINLASALVPWTKSISVLRGVRAAAVAESFAMRTGARAVLGAADAGIQTALMEPLFAAGRRDLGDDYTAIDSMANIAFGTAFGGGLHVLGGAAGDAMKSLRARGASAPAVEITPELRASAREMTPEQRVEAGIARESAMAGMPEIVEPRVTNSAEIGPRTIEFMSAKVENSNGKQVDGFRAEFDNTKGGTGYIDLAIDGGRVFPAMVDNGLFKLSETTNGAVRSAYEQAIDFADRNGFEFTSDDSVTIGAARIYDSLEKRGYQIERNENARLATSPEVITDRYVTDDGSPVFRVSKPVTAASTMAGVAPETREAALRAAVAQSVDGRQVDVDAIVGTDPALKSATDSDVKAAADRNFDPEQRSGVDFEASRAVDERLKAAPKNYALDDANMAMADAETALAETIKAGDQAFKYSRSESDFFKSQGIDAKTATQERISATLQKVAWRERGERNGFPTWKSDTVALDNPRDVTSTVDAFYLPTEGLKVAKWDIKNAGGEVVGHVALEMDGDWPTQLIDIEVQNGRKSQGIGDDVVGAIVGDTGELGIWNIVDSARSWWDRVGTAGDTLTADAYGNARAGRETARGDKGGVRYARSQTETPEFKAWFGDSKVVDADGKPLVVYHGTAADITSFDASRRGENTGAESAKAGFFFTNDTITAESYANYAATDAKIAALLREADKAERKGDWDAYDKNVQEYEALDASFSDPQNRLSGQNNVPVYLSLKNPLRVDAKGENAVGFDIAAAVKKASKGKYDGLVIENLDDAAGLVDRTATHYVAFNPEQIKSAIGNNGQFSPTNPDIRFSQGDGQATAPEQLTASLRESFGGSTDALVEAGRLKVVDTPEQIPGGPHPADVKAATAPDGTVYVVAQNVTPAEARGMVLHEVGVHVGFEQMLGPDVFKAVLSDLDGAIMSGREWAQAARAAVPADTPAGLVREEQLAYLVQNSPELPLVKRIIAAVRAWAYKTFEFARNRITLTEADYQALAVSALHAVARGESVPGVALAPAFSRDDLKISNAGGYESKASALDYQGARFEKFTIQKAGKRIGEIEAQVGKTEVTVRNALIYSADDTGKGIGKNAYQQLADAFPGKTVRSSFNENINGVVRSTGLSEQAIKMWQSFERTGDARRIETNDGRFFYELNRTGSTRYSRSETPDTSSSADELKPFDEKIARAKSYVNVLRAAADKLDNDAQAVAAMKSALPDLAPAEITDLLDGLRKQVKGLRGVTRSAREALNAENVATGMQYDAMQAADELANNIELASVIEKRNAALNLNVRMKSMSFVNQFRDAGLDVEGFRGLLVGTERKRAGGRISVDAEQKNFRGEWVGGMLADVEKAGLREAFISGAFDRDAYVALWNMAKGGDNSKLAPEAVKIAEIVNKYQTDARNTRNRFGAWIRDLQGYIVRQSHDMYKIRDAGEKAWIEHTLPRLDVEKMQRLGLFTGDIQASMRALYDDFATGQHMKPVTGEVETAAFGTGRNLAKKESASRSLYFKDGNAAYEYSAKFGEGRLAEAVLGGLDHAAKSAGLMKVLGTNPEATLTRLFDEYADSLRGDPVRRAKFMQSKKEVVENLLHVVDGTSNIPGNVNGAKIGSFLRAWSSMTKLGGALLSQISDLAGYAAELRFGQNKNLLSGTLDGIGALTSGRASGEKLAILNSLGVFHESMLGSVFARFDSPELVGGKTAWAMQQFFKLNGMTWWTEALRDGYALQHSNYLASNAAKAFDKLPAELRDMLSLYNIDAGKWDILRIATQAEADGRKYMTPEGLKTVPVAALENYITQAGRNVSDAAVMNLQDDLASALRTMTIDRMHHAVIEPNARSRAFLMRGTQPGTVTGELLRYVTQFKSFPTAMVQMGLGREVYGRGYDTLGDYLKNGKGDMLGLATFIGLSTMMGYAAMSAKDLVKGRNPRPVDDPRTWAAAMVQGGGLGIYGDFLFNKYNRMGGTLSSSMTGPVINTLDTAADLWTRVRTGDDFGAAALNAAIQNTPFLNLFYTRAALDYLILYRMQEAMNPGFLRRMEKRAERENGQTYYLPPSRAVQ